MMALFLFNSFFICFFWVVCTLHRFQEGTNLTAEFLALSIGHYCPWAGLREILLNMVTTDIHVDEGLAEGWQTIVCFSFSLYTQHNPATPGISKTINTRFYNIHTKLVFSDMLRSQNAISFLLEAHSIIVISFVIKSGYIIHNHMESFVLLMQHQ